MKKILIALALIMGVQTGADAQLLKKLGDALDKGAKKLDQATEKLDKALGGSQKQSTGSTTNTTSKAITKTIQSGPTSIKTEGDMRGLEISWIGASRIYGSNSVSLRYRNIHNGDQRLNIGIGEGYGKTPTYAIDGQSRRYGCVHVYIGGMGMGYACSCKMEAGTRDLVALRFDNVGTSVGSFETVVVSGTVGYTSSDWNHFILTATNIPISILPAITAKGVFGEQKVLIGQTIASIPKAFPYLYDAYTLSKEDDEGETITTVSFTLKGQETMTAVSYDNTTIANITVTTPNVNAKVKDTYYTCGTQHNLLKSIYGVEVDDYGRASYQGIYFDEDDDGKICSIQI